MSKLCKRSRSRSPKKAGTLNNKVLTTNRKRSERSKSPKTCTEDKSDATQDESTFDSNTKFTWTDQSKAVSHCVWGPFSLVVDGGEQPDEGWVWTIHTKQDWSPFDFEIAHSQDGEWPNTLKDESLKDTVDTAKYACERAAKSILVADRVQYSCSVCKKATTFNECRTCVCNQTICNALVCLSHHRWKYPSCNKAFHQNKLAATKNK
jgi:hypothetical protein